MRSGTTRGRRPPTAIVLCLIALLLPRLATAQSDAPLQNPVPESPNHPPPDLAAPGSTSAPATSNSAATPSTPAPVPSATDVPLTPAQPWPRNFPPVGVWDIVATSALAVGLVAVQFGVADPAEPKWTGVNGFDNWVRDGLRISSQGGRAAAATTSDVLVFTLTAFPLLNSVLVAGVEHERPDVMWRLLVLDAETLITVTLAAISLQKITARQRPYVLACKTDPSPPECSGGGQNASFPSAHTSLVFAAVALECFHHGFLDTSHTGWGAAACPVTVVAATITGVLRIAADRHWATDVIAGAVLGGGLGYAIPALHLAFGNTGTPVVVTPAVSMNYVGASIAGRF